MPNTLSQVSAGYVDAKGAQGRIKAYISWDTHDDGVTVFAAWIGAVSALTNAQVFSAPGIGGELTQSGDYGTSAEFDSITDKAVMTFIDSAGSIHRFQIPAPKAGIFLADKVTVNRAATDVATYVSLVVNGADNPFFLCTRGGLQFSSFAGGLRIKKPNRKRMTIFTKSGNLDEPAE